MACSVYVCGVKLNGIKRPPFLIAAGVVLVASVVQLLHFDFLEGIENRTYDWRVRRAASYNAATATNLGFVNINDQSISAVNNGSLDFQFGLYWPRHLYGRVVNQLRIEGDHLTAFDILFAGLRPDHLAVLMPDDKTLSSDEYFGKRLHEAGNVVLAAENTVLPHSLFRTNALALGDISSEKDTDGILRRVRPFRMYRVWHRAFQQLEDNSSIHADLDRAIVRSNSITLPRPGIDDDTSPPMRVELDSQGRFDVADFWGTNLPPRMVRYAKPFTEERVWQLGIVVAAEAMHLDLANAKVEPTRITLTGPNGLRRVIPLDEDGNLYINWCLKGDDKRLTTEPIEALLARSQARLPGADTNRFNRYITNRADWRGKLVFIGSTAVGNDLVDRGATPLEKDTILVSEHWNVANSLLTGQFVKRSSQWTDLFFIALMAAIAAFVTWECRKWNASWLAVFLIGGILTLYLGSALFIYLHFRYWIPVFMPSVGGLLVTHVCLLVYLVVFEQAEKRRVRSVFAKVMAPDVVAELLKSEKLSLTGARRKVTIFFSDIRGFTEMTDVSRDEAAEYIRQHNLTGEAAEAVFDKQAQETLATVNMYLKVIADVVRKNGGTVDKFIGDCVMAFWGAPVPNMHHALDCVRAAIEVQRAVYRLNLERMAENRAREGKNLLLASEGKPLLGMLPLLVVGTGINTGVVTVGLMGSDEQLNYTVFGREVNLASRLETVSGRARIIISEATLAEIIQDDATLALSCKALPPEKVKGIREPVPVFEVPWREGGATEDATPAPPAESYNTGYFTAGDRGAG